MTTRSGRSTPSTRESSVNDGRYDRGAVVWAPDPFRRGSNPRPWLVLVADSLPYPGQEYVCAALTTSDLPANHEIGDAWIAGRNPETPAYCSPWVLATVKHRAVVDSQGNVTDTFADAMAEKCTTYLHPENEGPGS